MDINAVTELANQIDLTVAGFIIKLAIAGTVLLLLKNFAQSLAAYLAFRSNKLLGLRVEVVCRDNMRVVRGKITKYNLNWIFIESNKKDELVIIPMLTWKSEIWSLKLNEKNHN